MEAFDEWRVTFPLNLARRAPSVVCCHGCLYAIGGSNGTGVYLSFVERLTNLKSKWESVKPMQIARAYHAAVGCNGWILVVEDRNEIKNEKVLKNTILLSMSGLMLVT